MTPFGGRSVGRSILGRSSKEWCGAAGRLGSWAQLLAARVCYYVAFGGKTGYVALLFPLNNTCFFNARSQRCCVLCG
jgi:hypothetical protein